MKKIAITPDYQMLMDAAITNLITAKKMLEKNLEGLYVVLAKDNLTGLKEPSFMYAVKLDTVTGGASVTLNIFDAYVFQIHNTALSTAANFRASNGRGALVWEVVTRRAQLELLVKENEERIEFFKETFDI